jgi:hypothetical protein
VPFRCFPDYSMAFVLDGIRDWNAILRLETVLEGSLPGSDGRSARTGSFLGPAMASQNNESK